MAYDEGLAERLRRVFEAERGVSEKKMFGGVCFLVDAKMCIGIVKDELMVRVGPEKHAAALAQPHTRPMDFSGKPMKGFVYVAPDGFESDARLKWWVTQGVAFARVAAKAAVRRSKPVRKKAARRKP